MSDNCTAVNGWRSEAVRVLLDARKTPTCLQQTPHVLDVFWVKRVVDRWLLVNLFYCQPCFLFLVLLFCFLFGRKLQNFG